MTNAPKVRTPAYSVCCPGAKIAALGANPYLSAGNAFTRLIIWLSVIFSSEFSASAGATNVPGAAFSTPCCASTTGAIEEMTSKLAATKICFIAFIVSSVGCATPNRLGLPALSEQWRRPSRRHCLLHRVKCALVCELLKTVLDVSTFLDGPGLRVETILRRPEVRRRS